MHQGIEPTATTATTATTTTTTTTAIPPKTMATRQEETHWDEDQRRALAHSHMRTMQELEEGDLDDRPDQSNRINRTTLHDPTTETTTTSATTMMMIVPTIPSQSGLSLSLTEETFTKNKKRVSSSESSFGFGLPIRQLWGNANLMRDNDNSRSQNEDPNDDFGARGASRKKQCVAVTSLILAIATIATITFIPSMRNSMESSVSHMAKEGEAFMSHGNKEQQVFSANILSAVMGDAVHLNMNVDGLYSPNYYPIGNTLPVLWMIPESGSDVVLNVLQYCLRLTAASGMGVNDQDRNSLSVLTYLDNIAHYVNVDTTTVQGLERANRLTMVESGLADFMATPYLGQAASLFASKMKTGRIFAILEDPVVRTMARYDYLRGLDDTYLNIPQTLVQYAESDLVEENVMTKVLANLTMETVVTLEHVSIAKMMIEHYVVVGVANHMEQSLEYFYDYFGWEMDVRDWKSCQTSFIDKHKFGFVINPESDEFSTLADRNWADVEVYDYAKNRFEKHAKRFRVSSL